ncbi:MAG: transposase, partial [Thermodesulfobacteriota bacterium]
MSRSTRLEFKGAVYHVMSRGVARMPVFLDDTDRTGFLDRVGELVGSDNLVVHAFCLMPNHYHLLCETPHGGLARLLRH